MTPDFDLLDGFHPLESDELGPYVWTKGAFRLAPRRAAPFAKIQLCYYGREGTLTIRNAAGRLVDTAELHQGWQPCVCRLDAEPNQTLSFQLDPVIPVPTDSRELGMMLRSIDLFDDERRFKALTSAERNHRLNQREFLQGVTRLKSYPPQLRVTMEVRCNLPETSQACVYCAWDFAKISERGAPTFTYQTLADLGEFYDCATEVVDCSIGEPTMKKDFGKIVRQLNEDGKFISLTTNGQLLGENRRREMLGKNMCIYVSIDASTAEGYSRYRNERFDDIVNNLKILCREKKQHGNLPRVFATFLVMRSNIGELPQYLDLMKEIGVDEVKLRSLNMDNLENQPTILNNGYTFNYQHEVLTNEELSQLDPIARAAARERGVDLYNETEQFAVAEISRESGAPLCSEPWKTLYFLNRGIMPCCYGGRPLARWEEQGDRSLSQFLGDVFNGEAMQEIRSELAAGRMAEYCLNTPSCPILKRMQLAGLVDPPATTPAVAATSDAPAIVPLEALKASLTRGEAA